MPSTEIPPNPYRFTGERVTTEMTHVALRHILTGLFLGNILPLRAYTLATEHLSRYEFTLQQLDLTGKTVLDLAGGDGYGSAILKQIGHPLEVVSVDIDLSAVKSAHKHHSPSVDFACADGQLLPFPASVFPIVTSFETYEHIPKPELLLSEIVRVLSPDGTLIISTPNRNISNPDRSRSDQPANPFHCFEVTPEEFDADLHRYFRQVDLFGQRLGTSPKNNHPTLANRLRNLTAVITGEISKIRPLQPSQEPVYLIAVCQNPIKS